MWLLLFDLCIEDPSSFLWNENRVDNIYTYRAEIPSLYYYRYSFKSMSEFIMEKGSMSRLFMGLNLKVIENLWNMGIIYDTSYYSYYNQEFKNSFLNLYTNLNEFLFEFRSISRYTLYEDSEDSLFIKSFSLEFKENRFTLIIEDSSTYLDGEINFKFKNFHNTIYALLNENNVECIHYTYGLPFWRIDLHGGGLFLDGLFYPEGEMGLKIDDYSIYGGRRLIYSKFHYLDLRNSLLFDLYILGIKKNAWLIESGLIRDGLSPYFNFQINFKVMESGLCYSNNILKFISNFHLDRVYFMWGISNVSEFLYDFQSSEVTLNSKIQFNFKETFYMGIKFYNITHSQPILYKSSLPLNMGGWILYFKWILPD